MQSGLAASRASASVVASTPRSRSRPARRPASCPSLAALDTQTPASSSSGRAATPAIACRPTLPVLHCTTLKLTTGPLGSQVRDAELHVRLLQTAVDVEHRTGQ